MVIDQLRSSKKFTARDLRQAPDVTVGGRDTRDSSYARTQAGRKENTEKASEFGGKRFLGLTPKGTSVFVKYRLTKEDMKLSVWFTHKLSTLLKEESKLANNRYDAGLNESLGSPAMMTRKLVKPHAQEVTIQTLRFLKRLELLTEMNYNSGFINNKPTKFIFRMIGNMIYNGDMDTSSVKPTLQDILEGEGWTFPDGGEYFVPENTWSYPGEL